MDRRFSSGSFWPDPLIQLNPIGQPRYRAYIKLAAKTIGLRKPIGWHAFRHAFGTILNANGENPTVIQELLRHTTLKVTMDTYVQAVTDEKRKSAE
ncbi:MAG: tyrosine-type recombinase/integrase [Pyrinomonadaceae bacterium]